VLSSGANARFPSKTYAAAAVRDAWFAPRTAGVITVTTVTTLGDVMKPDSPALAPSTRTLRSLRSLRSPCQATADVIVAGGEPA
jgi:hypothetical protein